MRPDRCVIDLNADLGESFGPWPMGHDRGTDGQHHLGQHRLWLSRRRPERAAPHGRRWPAANGVAIGAHPGFPDLVGFGRREMHVSPSEVEDLVLYQVAALAGIAAASGRRDCST